MSAPRKGRKYGSGIGTFSELLFVLLSAGTDLKKEEEKRWTRKSCTPVMGRM